VGTLFWRSRRVTKLTNADTVVLADFANSTGDAVFDDTLKTALTVALNESPFLDVLFQSRVIATLKLMSLEAVNCASGDVLAQDLVTAEKEEQVLDSLGEEASRLRAKLGDQNTLQCESLSH
jgi:eukaryotic-like serine/threonine-protein kinase